jgi:hypothetical protein
MSLHDLINRELDTPCKCQLQRHVQKLASAAKISFAKQALLQKASISVESSGRENVLENHCSCVLC